MSRKAPSKKTTHKRKKHTIDHEWLKKAFYKDHLEKGKSITSIAKRYVRVKKKSTVGSISGVLYSIKRQHKIDQAEVADLVADEGGVLLIADPPYVVNGEAGEPTKGKTYKSPSYFDDYDPQIKRENEAFDPYAKPSSLRYPNFNKVKPDTPTIKSLQQKADFHLSQYQKALKEILEVIGGEK